MIAKLEFLATLLFTMLAVITGKEIAIALSCLASISILAANYPKALENVKRIFKK